MKQSLKAVFEKGVFRPLRRPSISEGQHVLLTVETPTDAAGEDLISLACGVYEGLSEEEIAEVERIALDRQAFFSRPRG